MGCMIFPRKVRTVAAVVVLLVVVAASAPAQRKPKDAMSGYDRSARGTLVHPAIVYVAGDDNAQHVAEVAPGHEVVVSGGNIEAELKERLMAELVSA